MKAKYEEVELEVIKFTINDVIVTSDCPDDCPDDEDD